MGLYVACLHLGSWIQSGLGGGPRNKEKSILGAPLFRETTIYVWADAPTSCSPPPICLVLEPSVAGLGCVKGFVAAPSQGSVT